MSNAMEIDDFKENKNHTYANYLEWKGPERYQLINGEVYLMASPSVAHQALQADLLAEFVVWLRGKTCRVFGSPLDVRLFPKKDKSDNTIVQPDLLVVCDENKLEKGCVNGAPDLVIEIVSPSNSHSELFHKFYYYLKAGVKEYWVIDPEVKKVSVHILEKNHYISTIYEDDDSIPVTILPGLEISLKDLWARIPDFDNN
ncbi:MAG: Uma2 family endonuclease [Treponema sp.]|nr:Uma2 family endonuclease [Treponema sp.]